MVTSSLVYVGRAGFLSFVAAIAAATSCTSAGTPLPDAAPAPAATTPAPPRDHDDSASDAAAPADGSNAEAGTCADADGVMATCDGVTGAEACSAKTCQLALDELKSGVARAEVDCIRAQLKAGANCRFCRRVAVALACADTTADDVCARVMTTCKPDLDIAACKRRVAGLSFLGRQRFIACMTESSCQRTIDDCERLPPPPG